MSYMLPHLHSGWAVDQAILAEEERLVVVRFGTDYDPQCMQMDEILFNTAEQLKNFCVIYLVDIKEVPDFNTMYELYDPCTVMFFYRNKHMQIDLGTGNNNKINWALGSKQEFIDIVETIYRGARKGRGLVISPKDYSTKQRYYQSKRLIRREVNFDNSKILESYPEYSPYQDVHVREYWLSPTTKKRLEKCGMLRSGRSEVIDPDKLLTRISTKRKQVTLETEFSQRIKERQWAKLLLEAAWLKRILIRDLKHEDIATRKTTL